MTYKNIALSTWQGTLVLLHCKFLERTGHVAISQGVYGRGKGQEGYG